MFPLILLAGLVAPGQPEPGGPAAEPTPAIVNRLVRQLDADALADRDQAEQQLTAMGEAVLPLLPAASPLMPAGVQQRLTRIVNVIETAAAKSTGQPTQVTINGKMPLSAALQAMQQQTGNQIALADADPQVEVAFEKLRFFAALDSLLDQAQLNINAFGGTPGVMSLTTRPEGETDRAARAAYAGVFRFEPIRVQAVRNLRNPGVQGVRVAIRVEWEPRLRPISLSQPMSELTATDDLGNELSADAQGDRGAEVQRGVSAVELELPFQLPQRKATKITSLKGKLMAQIPGRVETFEFGGRLERTRGRELRKAGAAVVLERVRQNDNRFQVMIRIRFDEASSALESHRGWIFQNEAFIVNAAGNRVEHGGYEATRQDVNEVGVAYQFRLPEGLAGCKFVYRSPAMILQLPVEYEIKDIPLP